MSKPIPKMKYWQIKAPNEINQEMLSNLPKSKYFILSNSKMSWQKNNNSLLKSGNKMQINQQ
jgi:hypothetical protein